MCKLLLQVGVCGQHMQCIKVDKICDRAFIGDEDLHHKNIHERREYCMVEFIVFGYNRMLELMYTNQIVLLEN